MDRNFYAVLLMILDIQKIYTEYVDQASKVDNQYNKIQIHTLGLKQDLYISNNKRK